MFRHANVTGRIPSTEEKGHEDPGAFLTVSRGQSGDLHPIRANLIEALKGRCRDNT